MVDHIGWSSALAHRADDPHAIAPDNAPANLTVLIAVPAAVLAFPPAEMPAVVPTSSSRVVMVTLADWLGTVAMELAPKARRAAKIMVFIAFLLAGSMRVNVPDPVRVPRSFGRSGRSNGMVFWPKWMATARM
jgi:hypothetical protein